MRYTIRDRCFSLSTRGRVPRSPLTLGFGALFFDLLYLPLKAWLEAWAEFEAAIVVALRFSLLAFHQQRHAAVGIEQRGLRIQLDGFGEISDRAVQVVFEHQKNAAIVV